MPSASVSRSRATRRSCAAPCARTPRCAMPSAPPAMPPPSPKWKTSSRSTRGFTLTSDTRNGGLGVIPGPPDFTGGNIMNARLQQLEQKYTALDAQIAESPVKQALSLLHAMVHEVRREAGPSPAGAGRQGLTIRDIAELYRTAPAMEGPAQNTGLPVGTEAPDFALPDAEGKTVRLSDYRGKPVVLVFYPLDWSPGCSQQLDLYQHDLAEFTRRGAVLLGISVDSIYSHGAWAAVRGITFPLLADFHPKGAVAQSYRV